MIKGRQRNLLLALGVVILTGLGSRLIHTGYLLPDKYLGDALYSVMVYLLLALCCHGVSPPRQGILAMTVMTALELFQLTGIPLAMAGSGNLGLKVLGRLLGTVFSWLDLVAYGGGIIAVVCLDKLLSRHSINSFSL
jgi:hypothetical protein